MKNLLTALMLTVGLAAGASAARHTGDPVQTANPAGICDKLHEYGSPAWQACRAQFFADASSLICGREPQLSICQRGQQLLSAAEEQTVVAKASLICGREPQLSICKRGQLLSLVPKCPPGTMLGIDCRHQVVSNEKVGPQAGNEKVGVVKVAVAIPVIETPVMNISFDGSSLK